MKAYDLTHLARRVALLVLAAIGVHQLRYLIAYGSDSGAALSQQGHSYLGSMIPDVVGAAVVVMLATLAARIIAARQAGSASSRRGRPDWLFYSVAILAIFCSQELIEGSLASGHPAGIGALLANGGWVAAPLALAFGMLVALGLRLLDRADRVLVVLVQRKPARRHRPTATAGAPRHVMVPLARLALGFGFARRPPPLLSRSI